MKGRVVAFFYMLALVVVATATRAQTVKYEETFTSDSPPAGWLVINADSSANDENGLTAWAYVSQIDFIGGDVVTPQSGVNFWFSSYAYANGLRINEYLISPQIQGITAGDSLIFFAGAIDGGFNDSLRVFISTGDNSLASFTNQIGYLKVDGPVSTYHRYAFDLSSFAGSNIFFAINYFIVDGGEDGTHSDNVWLDHFIVTNGMPTSVADDPGIIIKFELSQNYPNPFNPTTTIAFAVPQETKVHIKIYNLVGQLVATPVDGQQYSRGRHTVQVDASRLPNAVYFYRMEAGDFVQLKKMTVLK